MQIRPATAQDYESIAALYPMVQDSHASAYPHLFKPTSKGGFTRAAFESLLAQGKIFLIGIQNNHVLG